MADHDRVDKDVSQQQGGGMPVGVSFHYRTYSYVVVSSASAGTFNLTGQQLVSVFGKYGKGNVVQQSTLLGVIMGDSNQLIVQPPRITFKGAAEEILLELYGNAKPLVLKPVESHPAKAFGINFELEVESPRIQPKELLQRLLGVDVAGWLRLQSATVEREGSFYTLRITSEQPERLYVSINNHIANPPLPNFDSEMLKEKIGYYRDNNEKTLRELYECVQKPQS